MFISTGFWNKRRWGQRSAWGHLSGKLPGIALCFIHHWKVCKRKRSLGRTVWNISLPGWPCFLYSKHSDLTKKRITGFIIQEEASSQSVLGRSWRSYFLQRFSNAYNAYTRAQSMSLPSAALKAIFAAPPPFITPFLVSWMALFFSFFFSFLSLSPHSLSPKYSALVLCGDFAQTRLALGKVPSPESVLRSPRVVTTMNTLSSPHFHLVATAAIFKSPDD